ncbi:MAG: hypothetical protein KAG66_22370 [Methylococcales bacterium]|nr:hypothetical protein [Methylococcales bacterium]
MISKTEIPDSLRVILQRCLLGAITPDMRLIALKFENKALTIRIYFDKPPTSDNIESASIIGTNVSVMGGGPRIDSLKEECVYSQEPFGKLDTLDGVVYARDETT